MRTCIVLEGEVLLNRTGMGNSEIIEYSKTVLATGIPLSMGNRITFRSYEDLVFCLPSKFEEDEALQMLKSILLDLRPYPRWLLDLSKNRKVSGLHTVILVSGDGRFEIREELTKYASLVENTGKEDIYISKGKFVPDLDLERTYISHGEDLTENLRRVYAMEKFTDGEGMKIYENLPRERFVGPGSIRGILIEKSVSDVEFLLESVRTFRKDLIDLRSPIEIAWILGGTGG